MGLHGNPLDLTPNLDRMAREGTHLKHCFTPQPVCGPARSVLQSGVYATETGCFRNGIALPTNIAALAKRFNHAGYQTAYIGKWHLAGSENRPGAVPKKYRGGYDYWLGAEVLEFTSEPYHTVVYDNNNKPVELPGYRVDALADAAIRYIDGHKNKPFFLFLSFLEPHHQNHLDDYPPPDGYRERYAGKWTPPDLAALGGSSQQHLGGYWGMVKRLDEALGRLLDALKSMGLRENTIVVFTSDHGCHFKTRNGEYKRSCHDSSLRVPGAICGPGFDRGGEVQELVSLIDLPPTLLDAAGIPVPNKMKGRSLLRLLRGEDDSWPDDVFAQISEAEIGRAVRTRRWKYAVRAPGSEKNHKGGQEPGAKRYQEAFLYDLRCDPYELNNLIGLNSHDKVAARMRQRLLARMKEAGEARSVIVKAPSRHGGQRRAGPEEVEA